MAKHPNAVASGASAPVSASARRPRPAVAIPVAVRARPTRIATPRRGSERRSTVRSTRIRCGGDTGAPIDSQGVSSEAARRPRLVWAAGVVVMVLAGLAGLGIFLAKQPFGFDLWAYVLAARHLLAGEPLYSAGATDAGRTVRRVPLRADRRGPLRAARAAAVLAGDERLDRPRTRGRGGHRPVPHPSAAARCSAVGGGRVRPVPADDPRDLAGQHQPHHARALPASRGRCAGARRSRRASRGRDRSEAASPLARALLSRRGARPRRRSGLSPSSLRGCVLTTVVFWREMPGLRRPVRRTSAKRLRPRSSSRKHDRQSSLRSSARRSAPGFSRPPRWRPRSWAASRSGGCHTTKRTFTISPSPMRRISACSACCGFPTSVFALPLMASSFHRALLFPHPQLRVVLVAALAVSWLLMQIVGEEGDAMPFAAHLLGLLILLVVALACSRTRIASPPGRASERARPHDATARSRRCWRCWCSQPRLPSRRTPCGLGTRCSTRARSRTAFTSVRTSWTSARIRRGYIFYVAVAAALRVFTRDSNAALVIVSIVASALTAAAVYLLCRRYADRALAIVVSLGAASAPLAWTYGEVAMPYALLGLLSVVLAGALRDARSRPWPAALIVSAGLGLAAGFRQDVLLLLGPLWLWMLLARPMARARALRRRRRDRVSRVVRPERAAVGRPGRVLASLGGQATRVSELSPAAGGDALLRKRSSRSTRCGGDSRLRAAALAAIVAALTARRRVSPRTRCSSRCGSSPRRSCT